MDKKIKGLKNAIIFLSLILMVLLVGIIFSYTNNPKSTGKIIYNEKKPIPTKNCFYEIGEKSLSIYNCFTLEDCKNQIENLTNEEMLKDFDMSNITVLDCQ